MKNMKLTKTEEIKRLKRSRRIIIAIAIILFVVIIYSFGKEVIFKWNENEKFISPNETLMSYSECQKEIDETCETKSFVDVITNSIKALVTVPLGFWTKFFIFLGILYLIQIIITAAFDIFEIILIISVGIWRIFKKIKWKK